MDMKININKKIGDWLETKKKQNSLTPNSISYNNVALRPNEIVLNNTAFLVYFLI